MKDSTQGFLFRFECEYVAYYSLRIELITLLFSTCECFKYLLRISNDEYSRARYVTTMIIFWANINSNKSCSHVSSTFGKWLLPPPTETYVNILSSSPPTFSCRPPVIQNINLGSPLGDCVKRLSWFTTK